MTRRVVVAMMEHETNTFSPVPTPLERFGRGGFGVPTGPEVVERFRGTGTGLGGLLDVALDAGYRAGFRALARHELACNGVGVTSSDNSLFRFDKVRRPIFPLDPNTPPTPEYGPPPTN